MSYPGDQDPPSRGEWWMSDPRYSRPARSSPEAAESGAQPRRGGHRARYPSEGGSSGEPSSGGYRSGRGRNRYGPGRHGPGYTPSRYGSSGYGSPDGSRPYGDTGPYGEPTSYGDTGAYGDHGSYGNHGSYGDQGGYGDHGGYGDLGSYGAGAGGYREPGPGGRYGRTLPAPTGAAGSRDPARGFPPAPGAALRAYPPGAFSAWNPPTDEEDATGMGSADAGNTPGSRAAGWPDAAAGPGMAAARGFASSSGTGDTTVALADPAGSPRWGYVHGTDGTFTGEAGPEAQDDGWAYRHQTLGPAATQQIEAPDHLDDALEAPAVTGKRVSKRRAARPPRTRRKLLIGVIAAVAVAALGGTALYALTGHGKPVAARSTPPTPAASKPQPKPTPTLGKWGHIATRAADPAPLTLAELYPATASAGGQSYSRSAQRMDTNCPHAVFGSALRAATHKGHCTQVARATYISGDGKVMGTIGVLNLANYQAAEQVGKVAGSNEFIGPLAGSSSPTRDIAKGTGLVQAEIKGHYLILSWAEYANLHRPSTSHDRTVLVTFSNGLIQSTANRSLTDRMVTGRPPT